jgi:hypothetical protein
MACGIPANLLVMSGALGLTTLSDFTTDRLCDFEDLAAAIFGQLGAFTL